MNKVVIIMRDGEIEKILSSENSEIVLIDWDEIDGDSGDVLSWAVKGDKGMANDVVLKVVSDLKFRRTCQRCKYVGDDGDFAYPGKCHFCAGADDFSQVEEVDAVEMAQDVPYPVDGDEAETRDTSPVYLGSTEEGEAQ